MENCLCAAKLECNSYFSSNWKTICTLDLIGQVLKTPPLPVSLLFTKETISQSQAFAETNRPMRGSHLQNEVGWWGQNCTFKLLLTGLFTKMENIFFVFQATVNLGQTRRKRFQVKNIFHLVEIYEKAKNAWFTVFPSHHLPIWLFDSFVWIYKNL